MLLYIVNHPSENNKQGIGLNCPNYRIYRR